MGVDMGMRMCFSTFCLCMLWGDIFIFFEIGIMLFNVTSFCQLMLFITECFLCAKYSSRSGNVAANQTDKSLLSSCCHIYSWENTIKKVKLVKHIS